MKLCNYCLLQLLLWTNYVQTELLVTFVNCDEHFRSPPTMESWFHRWWYGDRKCLSELMNIASSLVHRPWAVYTFSKLWNTTSQCISCSWPVFSQQNLYHCIHQHNAALDVVVTVFIYGTKRLWLQISTQVVEHVLRIDSAYKLLPGLQRLGVKGAQPHYLLVWHWLYPNST